MQTFNVTRKAIRPASVKEQCFYCSKPIGSTHAPDCVLVKKRVRIKVFTELTVEIPHFWDEETIRFYYNDGSWCAANLADIIEDNGCICENTEIIPLTHTGEAFLQE
jgi:hypothetical protein